MALTPPTLGEVLKQISDLAEKQNIKGEADRALKALTQTALHKLEVVSREEFDAQSAILEKTRARVEELEAEIARLGEELDQLDKA